MSNFQCPHCRMTNIDYVKGVDKTPREIELEERIEKLIKEIGAINFKDNTIPHLFGKSFKEIRGIIESEEQLKYKLKIAVEALKVIEKEYPDVPGGLNIRARYALVAMDEIEMDSKRTQNKELNKVTATQTKARRDDKEIKEIENEN